MQGDVRHIDMAENDWPLITWRNFFNAHFVKSQKFGSFQAHSLKTFFKMFPAHLFISPVLISSCHIFWKTWILITFRKFSETSILTTFTYRVSETLVLITVTRTVLKSDVRHIDMAENEWSLIPCHVTQLWKQ